jgi:hypothetical protein
MKVKKPVVKRGDGYWDIYINGENVISVDYDFGTIMLFLSRNVKPIIHRAGSFGIYTFRGAVKPSPVSSHSSNSRRMEG